MGKVISFIIVLVYLFLSGFNTQAETKTDPDENASPGMELSENIKQKPAALRLEKNYSKIPLYFIFNEGQVNSRAKFYARAHGYTLWMTAEGLVFDKTRKMKNDKDFSEFENHPLLKKPQSDHTSGTERNVSRMMFINANESTKIITGEATDHKVNYFKGTDRSKWITDVETSKSVKYENLYSGIDLKVYGIEIQIEYDWIVHPGADPADINFKYENVKSIEVSIDGNLVINTDFGSLIHKRPVSYQVIDGRKIDVAVDFKKLGNNCYGFAVSEYNTEYDLIIDPLILEDSTYLGGSDWDYGYGIAVDSSGAAYITGYTGSSDFPTLNQYQTEQGGYDAFVTKLSSEGSTLIYSTYLGGSNWDYGYGIAVDSSGAAYITGYTWSSDFPTLNQYQTHQKSTDAFVTKLAPAGNSLVYSTYLGGSDDDLGRTIAVDSSGAAYITGYTWSADFPTLNQYLTYQGSYDAFVTKLSSEGSTLVYSTYLGGSDEDYGYKIAVDSSGAAYITGYAESSDFPTVNQYKTDQGKYDIIAKLQWENLNSAPVAVIDADLFGGIAQAFITFDGSKSYYIYGFIESWRWIFGDGATGKP
ncbi:MAG: SBBP repeat-containing protein [Acidobacteria bacterium]|nr:SBBP repeat-containing protein [Acidobacteriota bacterium]